MSSLSREELDADTKATTGIPNEDVNMDVDGILGLAPRVDAESAYSHLEDGFAPLGPPDSNGFQLQVPRPGSPLAVEIHAYLFNAPQSTGTSTLFGMDAAFEARTRSIVESWVHHDLARVDGDGEENTNQWSVDDFQASSHQSHTLPSPLRAPFPPLYEDSPIYALANGSPATPAVNLAPLAPALRTVSLPGTPSPHLGLQLDPDWSDATLRAPISVPERQVVFGQDVTDMDDRTFLLWYTRQTPQPPPPPNPQMKKHRPSAVEMWEAQERMPVGASAVLYPR